MEKEKEGKSEEGRNESSGMRNEKVCGRKSDRRQGCSRKPDFRPIPIQ
jgi:hypothetical protein